jgi:hypothetical protein
LLALPGAPRGTGLALWATRHQPGRVRRIDGDSMEQNPRIARLLLMLGVLIVIVLVLRALGFE